MVIRQIKEWLLGDGSVQPVIVYGVDPVGVSEEELEYSVWFRFPGLRIRIQTL